MTALNKAALLAVAAGMAAMAGAGDARAWVYCTSPGVPAGCVANPNGIGVFPGAGAGAAGPGLAPGVGGVGSGIGVYPGAGAGAAGVGLAPGVGGVGSGVGVYPGAGAGAAGPGLAPGAGVNAGGPVNRAGFR